MAYLRLNKHEDVFFKADVKTIESKIIDFIIDLKDRRKSSPSTISQYVSAVKLFYDMNYVTSLNWKKIHAYQPEYYKVVEDEAYTHDQIKRMVDVADLRDKAIILLMTSTGMRIGAVPKLRLEDIKSVEENNTEVPRSYQITVYKKAKEQLFGLQKKMWRKTD
jgi:site-specific recombinase XerD